MSQLKQTTALIGLCVDLTLDPRAENLVLLLQEFDVPSQLAVGHGGDQGQQWVVNRRHPGIVAVCTVEWDYTFLVQRFDPLKTTVKRSSNG
ncbi:hypothetical protein [Caulifigura coniformis]|uniref:hypothetical protein n=1 Tax=Caulifigura coniformis TaxID=2527983 RepID=UPI00119F491C|nr:hypothetical protein [Caulifigura coniformis]